MNKEEWENSYDILLYLIKREIKKYQKLYEEDPSEFNRGCAVGSSSLDLDVIVGCYEMQKILETHNPK